MPQSGSFSAILLAMFIASIGSVSAKCNNPWDCNKKGLGNIVKEGGKILDQARTDLSNGLNRIDPRLTQIGRDFDRMRLEFQSSVFTGPALEQWIIASRNSSYPTAAPIYPEMREVLRGWYSDALLDKVRFKVGDGGALNLANNTLTFNDGVQAVALIDVIIFRGPEEAKSPETWAHEMHHIRQYDEWGVRKFAIRYMRSWNSVENDAYDAQRRFAAAFNSEANAVQTAASSTYSWKQIRTGDCGGADYNCSRGDKPVATECTAAIANRTSVCWTGGRNPHFPKGTAGNGCRGAADWCTYKTTPANGCTGGLNPGVLWVCSRD
jgi:Domain of unknown function (DUF4157)